MTIRKESKQYIRQQRKIDADLVKRPNEILKRTTDDGNLKLTFKSPTYYEKDIVVTKNAMLSSTPLIKSYKPLETSESFILDLDGQEIITYNLTQNTTITDVVNYNNGMSYKLYLKQDEVGGKSFVFDETISNITLFDNFQIDQTPNSITQIKIDVVEDTLYIQSYVKYKKVEYSPYGTFSFTIDTTLGSNAGPSFQLGLKDRGFDSGLYVKDGEPSDETPYYMELNYDFIVDWGDGQTNHITSWDDINKNHNYSVDGEYQISISGLCEGYGTYNNWWEYNNATYDQEKIIRIDNISYVGFKDLTGFMEDCENLINVNNVSSDAFKDVIIMFSMFYGCSLLSSLDVSNWNVSNVDNMFYMFYYCSSLTTLDVSNWDVSNVTNMKGMFRDCSSLKTLDVSNWNVSNVTDMYEMFRDCSSLTTLNASNWNASNVTDMRFMFDGCSSLTTLNVSNWDVSNVTHMYSMFYACSSLATLDVSNWDVSNVIYMEFMFAECSSLTTLDVSNWDVSNVTHMIGMFDACSSLATLDVSNWNVSNVSTMQYMFRDCSLNTASYDALLIRLSELPSLQSNVRLDANLAKYSAGAAADARQYIINTYGWTINDGGQVV